MLLCVAGDRDEAGAEGVVGTCEFFHMFCGETIVFGSDSEEESEEDSNEDFETEEESGEESEEEFELDDPTSITKVQVIPDDEQAFCTKPYKT